ncbi:MAG: THUMP domain-containing protein [archaeon]
MLEPNLILAKASPEFTIKSDEVRRQFEKTLLANLRLCFKNAGVRAKISCSRGRIFVLAENPEGAIRAMKTVFGLHSIALGHEIAGNSLNDVSSALLGVADGFLESKDSFALRVNRIAANALSSQELGRELGSAVMDSIAGLKVDLSNPKKEIFIELLEGKTIFFTKPEKGAGGLPAGTAGKAAFVFSGLPREFDAALMLMKRGCSLIAIAENPSKKTLGEIERLSGWNCGNPLRMRSLEEARRLGAIGIGSAESDIRVVLAREKSGFELFPLLFAPKAGEAKARCASE